MIKVSNIDVFSPSLQLVELINLIHASIVISKCDVSEAD